MVFLLKKRSIFGDGKRLVGWNNAPSSEDWYDNMEAVEQMCLCLNYVLREDGCEKCAILYSVIFDELAGKVLCLELS